MQKGTALIHISEGLLLLHLSDIHFREPYCLNPDTDQDHPVRKALINDIEEMVKRLGNVDAILVSGDIAFKGHSEEYRAAAKWLSDVSQVAGCPQNCIFVVPGNHDVNRQMASARSVQGSRKLINDKESGPHRDKELHDTLLDKKTGPELFIPMEEYTLFAASYGCELDRERPFWSDFLEKNLAPGWRLKIHGLTTTFFSGPDDDKKGDLYLGALQRVFAPDDGIVRLAMMHHPPDWLEDSDEIDDALRESCALHLLGHKHRQRYKTDDNGVQLVAGAVNPSRTEKNWDPGYNLIKLRIIIDAPKNKLRIESHLRLWQASPDRFVSKKTADDEDVFVHEITLRRKPLFVNADSTEKTKDNVGDSKMIRDTVTDGCKITGDAGSGGACPDVKMRQRDIVFQFWQLTPSQRRKIMQDLKLISPEDDELTEPQKYRRAFERARSLCKIEVLEAEISKMHL